MHTSIQNLKDWQNISSDNTLLSQQKQSPIQLSSIHTTFKASDSQKTIVDQSNVHDNGNQSDPQEIDKQKKITNKALGMMSNSQPSTPVTENVLQQPESPVLNAPIQTSPRPMMRGRANLFAAETGPYFSSTKPFDNLYSSDKQTLLSVRVQAKMDRGFFLADNDWTCYRRNYFQVSSVFSIHGFNHYYAMNEPILYVKSNDLLYPVQRFLLGVSAKIANGPKEIELIQHTPKRDKGPQFKPSPKPISPGGNLSMSSVANSQNIVTFQRIQFKTATANNGKRRAAQQYYTCIIELFAETDRNELVKVASCQSAPLVVRGRSPGHYADNGANRHHTNNASYDPSIHQPLLSSSANPNTNITSNTNSEIKIPRPSNISRTGSTGDDGYPKPFQPPHQEMMPPQNHYAQPPQEYAYYYPQYHSPYSSHPPLPSPYTHNVPNYVQEQSDAYHEKAPPQQQPHYLPQHMNDPSYHDWQRARYNSASTGSSSVPSPQPRQDQPHYFSQPDHRSYSPTTPTFPMIHHQQSPTTPTGAKYNNVPNLIK